MNSYKFLADNLIKSNHLFSPNSKGVNKLLRMGATPVTSTEEVLEALGFETDSKDKQASLFDDLSPEEKMVMKLLH